MVAEQPLEHRLALGVLEAHPREAARALEGLSRPAVAAVLAEAPPGSAAPALEALAPQDGAEVLQAMEGRAAGRILDALPADRAALLLRRIAEPARSELRDALSPRPARRVGVLLRYPERSAGALMDPGVLALPEDVSAEEALRRLRADAAHAHFYLYVVDREGRLTGVLDLRELLAAEPGAPLGRVARRPEARLRGGDDAHAVLEHPGWGELRALPVVDGAGRFLGAVRLATVRRLAVELGRVSAEPDATARALGELFGSGLAAVARAVAGVGARPFAAGGGPGGAPP